MLLLENWMKDSDQAPSTPRQSLLPKSARLAYVTKFPGDARNFEMVTGSSQNLDSESGLTPGWEHDSLCDGATWGLQAICPPKHWADLPQLSSLPGISKVSEVHVHQRLTLWLQPHPSNLRRATVTVLRGIIAIYECL